jgi:uracil-DNA glycosylase
MTLGHVSYLDPEMIGLHELLLKRFGDRYALNLRGGAPLQLNFEAPHSYGPASKCADCPATKYRQDLPFWQGALPKRYMLVAQDAGKGEEHPDRPEFNTVFSIHRLFNEPQAYLKEARHARYHAYLRSLLPEADDLGSMYFTDLVKCAFSTGGMDAAACPCRSDLLAEMAAVRPQVVVFFGSQAFAAGRAMLEAQGFAFQALGEPVRVRVNKSRELTIQMGRCAGRKELFLGIPQLGQNRYSNEGYARMLEVMRAQVRPVIMQHLSDPVD